jgi:hypothetical protein
MYFIARVRDNPVAEGESESKLLSSPVRSIQFILLLLLLLLLTRVNSGNRFDCVCLLL